MTPGNTSCENLPKSQNEKIKQLFVCDPMEPSDINHLIQDWHIDYGDLDQLIGDWHIDYGEWNSIKP